MYGMSCSHAPSLGTYDDFGMSGFFNFYNPLKNERMSYAPLDDDYTLIVMMIMMIMMTLYNIPSTLWYRHAGYHSRA